MGIYLHSLYHVNIDYSNGKKKKSVKQLYFTVQEHGQTHGGTSKDYKMVWVYTHFWQKSLVLPFNAEKLWTV